jgi:DNA-binding XRE family transcriptional regulator
MNEPKLIAEIGEALFGERWKSDLARELGVSRDTVDDWTKERMKPRPGVYRDLAKIVERRQAELNKLPAKIAAGLAAAEARQA